MLPALSIAPATATDIPALVALVNSAYRGDTSRQGWTTEADLLEGTRTDAADLADLMAGPGATFLLARTANGELRGSVYLKNQHPDLYLGMLTVDPAHQAHGIGKYLLAAAERQARHLGCTSILMSVISVRHELLAWYARHGFRQTGETVAFPTDVRFGVPRQELVLLLLRKQLENLHADSSPN
ncbi:GNAT family N-acetyltransferase [Hymenobacter sp. AT01-02]|uniref:GNAT family N-acetyltransferase n=1 Tax=Hymenobacter sp. AT01-02 TaxID=1571877 RepID=UPI0005F1D208|nr:GNAT family N-acetyltransferase [Hymenobacter sp. AT01-02]